MKILVTGGSGFLGSHLCARLLNDGHYVIALDNFYTGRRENVSDLVRNKNFEIIHHDVINPIFLEIDGIFNLACPASPIHYQRDPIQTLKTSILGALNMLELAQKNKARILQASTSEIYGDPEVDPQAEIYWGNVNPVGIRACYDEGKRAAETLFVDFQRQFELDIRIARIFNTYGPNMAINDGRVISNFFMQALRGSDLTIYGDGSHTRSFCYVDDLIDGLISLFFAENIFEPINLGNPQPITMLELAGEIVSLTKSSSKVVHQSLPSDDPKDRRPDISKAFKSFGWKPQVSRADGLALTYNYFQKLIQVTDS
jgi:UDP-glucuronate decarboxylase